MSNYAVVPAQPLDVYAIQEVLYRTWLFTYPNVDHDITIEDIDDHFRSRLDPAVIERRRHMLEKPAPGEIRLVAKREAEVIGVCFASVHNENNELRVLYVLPEYHGRGVGYALWSEALKHLAGTKETVLAVAPYNAQAIRFYERLGFVKGRMELAQENFKMRNGKAIPGLLMTRRPQ